MITAQSTDFAHRMTWVHAPNSSCLLVRLRDLLHSSKRPSSLTTSSTVDQVDNTSAQSTSVTLLGKSLDVMRYDSEQLSSSMVVSGPGQPTPKMMSWHWIEVGIPSLASSTEHGGSCCFFVSFAWLRPLRVSLAERVCYCEPKKCPACMAQNVNILPH